MSLFNKMKEKATTFSKKTSGTFSAATEEAIKNANSIAQDLQSSLNKMKTSVALEVIKKNAVEQGLVVSKAKQGSKLNIYATGVNTAGEITPLRAKIASFDFDEITKGCPDALFYTFIVEHEDDKEYKQIEE